MSAAEQPQRKPGRRGWLRWTAFLALVGLAVGGALRHADLPAPVRVARPQIREVTQTIAASGQVGGRRETVVGSQVQGVVAELWVNEGDVVTRGQGLARVRNEVAQAQVLQAQQALRTARAQLEQAAQGPRSSELAAAQARIHQAEAAVRQSEAQLTQAQAAVDQSEARRTLAQKNLERYRYLLGEGAIARQIVDQAEADERVAMAQVASARDGVITAQASVAGAREALTAAKADRRTLAAGPLPQTVEVARQRVREAAAALRVAREQARSAVVRAPFAGTVTEIIAEIGAPTGPNGIVRLVQTGRPEIRVDMDESNLADLRVGQRAVITSATFRGAHLEGRVTELGARVDPSRGTVQVTVVPATSPAWLRPGATVNVNVVVAESVPRLVVPTTAVRREGDGRVVLVFQNGRTVARPVIVGPVEGDTVPVLEGLSRDDLLILQADQMQPGIRVRVRGER